MAQINITSVTYGENPRPQVSDVQIALSDAYILTANANHFIQPSALNYWQDNGSLFERLWALQHRYKINQVSEYESLWLNQLTGETVLKDSRSINEELKFDIKEFIDNAKSKCKRPLWTDKNQAGMPVANGVYFYFDGVWPTKESIASLYDNYLANEGHAKEDNKYLELGGAERLSVVSIPTIDLTDENRSLLEEWYCKNWFDMTRDEKDWYLSTLNFEQRDNFDINANESCRLKYRKRYIPLESIEIVGVSIDDILNPNVAVDGLRVCCETEDVDVSTVIEVKA